LKSHSRFDAVTLASKLYEAAHESFSNVSGAPVEFEDHPVESSGLPTRDFEKALVPLGSLRRSLEFIQRFDEILHEFVQQAHGG
jgi:hypothetical protein